MCLDFLTVIYNNINHFAQKVNNSVSECDGFDKNSQATFIQIIEIIFIQRSRESFYEFIFVCKSLFLSLEYYFGSDIP